MTREVDAGPPIGSWSGPAYLLTSTIVLAGLDSTAKGIGGSFPITEVVWIRNAVPLAIAVVIFAPRLGTALLRTRSLRLQLLRSLALLATTVLFFLSLRELPLADAAAITFAAPLITVALSGPLLGERVSWLSAAAAVVGFVGVIAVIQPFSGQFGPASLLALGAAFSSSLYSMLTRAMGGRDAAATTWFYTSTVGVAVMSLGAPFGWVIPTDPGDLAMLLLLGVLGGAGHFLLIKAYQRAAASVLAPLAYVQLVWVTVIGLAVFDELPNLLSLAGIALIAGSGIIVAVHPRAVEPRSQEAQLPPPQ